MSDETLQDRLDRMDRDILVMRRLLIEGDPALNYDPLLLQLRSIRTDQQAMRKILDQLASDRRPHPLRRESIVAATVLVAASNALAVYEIRHALGLNPYGAVLVSTVGLVLALLLVAVTGK